MKKSILFIIMILTILAVTGCHQYVPTPGQADMVQYTHVGPDYGQDNGQ